MESDKGLKKSENQIDLIFIIGSLFKQSLLIVIGMVPISLGVAAAIAVTYGLTLLIPSDVLFNGISVLSGSLILAFFKDIGATFRKLKKMISSHDDFFFIEITIEFFALSLGFFLAFSPFLFCGTLRGDPGPLIFDIGQKQVIDDTIKNTSGDLLILDNFAIMFQSSQEGPIASFLVTFLEGKSKIEEDRFNFIDQLIANLSDCSEHGQRKLELEIVGYASSSEFSDESEDNSDVRNLELANKRAEAVKEYIDNKGTNSGQIVTKLKKWTSFHAMESARKYNDRFDPGDVYSEKMGYLNRRVEISILSAAQCEPKTEL